MADLTPEEIFSGAAAAGGRVSIAKNEVLRLLESSVPGCVAYQNARESVAIPVPKRYYQSREDLEGIETPAILVGASVDMSSAAPRVNFAKFTLGIHVVFGAVGTREDLDNMWDMAQIVALVMKQTQPGWKLPSPDGRNVWRSCIPSSVEQLPGKWDKYSGVSCYFNVEQNGLDLWTPVAP